MSPRSRSLLGAASLAALAAPLLPAALRDRLPAAEAALWQTIAAQLAWCGIACGFALLAGGSVRERLGLRRGDAPAAAVALAAAGTLALSGALQFAVTALALAPGSALERLDAIVRAAAPQSPWLVLLAFGIAPGFGEELLFRGAIQRSLARAVGPWSIALAAAAFGALHLDRVHSPAAFALGCYLGALAWLGRSTWIAIACHVANNLAAALSQLAPQLAALQPRSWGGAAAWLLAAALALAAFGASAARSRAPREAPSG